MSLTAHAADISQSAYDFSFKVLRNPSTTLPLEQFKGKVLLVVNTASKCGFTPQFEGLEKLYQTYKNKGFMVVGVPSADFGGQEFSLATETEQLCRQNYGVTFPMAEREVVSGDGAHPFYKWATQHGGFLGTPRWNFHKYLIGKNGEYLDYFASTTEPMADKLVTAVEKALAAE